MTVTRPRPSHFGKTGMPKPGTFKAHCRLNQPVPFVDLTEAQRDLVEELRRGAYWKRNVQVVDVPCRFETTDRGEFDDHMKTVHNRTIGRKVWPNDDSGLPPRTLPGWKPPKLTEEGTPWPEDDRRTESCACGLVAEVGDRYADQQWWNEHINFCTQRGAA